MAAAAAPRWLWAARACAGLALVAYPALVWVGLTRWSPRVLALVLLGVMLPVVGLRLRSRSPGQARDAAAGLAALPLVTVAALALAAILDAGGSMLLVPVAINAALLVAFGATLRGRSVPMIERFARLQRSGLSPEQQAWCRRWTGIWCLCFAFNGAAALALALAAPLAWWAIYNGLVAYVLVGLLLATEWVLRRRRFGAGAPSLADAAGDARRSATVGGDARLGGAARASGGRADDPRDARAGP